MKLAGTFHRDLLNSGPSQLNPHKGIAVASVSCCTIYCCSFQNALCLILDAVYGTCSNVRMHIENQLA